MNDLSQAKYASGRSPAFIWATRMPHPLYTRVTFTPSRCSNAVMVSSTAGRSMAPASNFSSGSSAHTSPSTGSNP